MSIPTSFFSSFSYTIRFFCEKEAEIHPKNEPSIALQPREITFLTCPNRVSQPRQTAPPSSRATLKYLQSDATIREGLHDRSRRTMRPFAKAVTTAP